MTAIEEAQHPAMECDISPVRTIKISIKFKPHCVRNVLFSLKRFKRLKRFGILSIFG